MEKNISNCCSLSKKEQSRGILQGIFLGIVPHSFCIAFFVFSIFGAVAATAFLKKVLLIPHLFAFLVAISLLLATISVSLYLKKTKCFCKEGIKSKWRYISLMYATTLISNLLMFFVIIPHLVNASPISGSEGAKATLQNNSQKLDGLAETIISVQIPCSGHSALIMDEIRKNYHVYSIKFDAPNSFDIRYDPLEVSPEKITSLEIFKAYPATIVKSGNKVDS